MNWTYDNEMTIFYSLNFDPNVYDFDMKSFTFSTTSLKEPRTELPPPIAKNGSSQENWMHFQANLSYSKILVDTVGSHFLRFVMLPNNMQSMLCGENNSELPKRVVMDIYDGALVYQGDVSLGRDYAFKNSFFSMDKLWIQIYEDTEDALCFEIFEL